MRVFDGRQIAAARALANVSAIDLARVAGVTPRTIARAEDDAVIAVSAKRRHGHMTRSTLDRIIAALTERGVELVDETESTGSGVRWKHPRGRRHRSEDRD